VLNAIIINKFLPDKVYSSLKVGMIYTKKAKDLTYLQYTILKCYRNGNLQDVLKAK